MASEQEREYLFHLLHDLVDEALEQYAAGYAVNLEDRYYELADQLIASRTLAAEQQLAQARDLVSRLHGSFRHDIYTELQASACSDAEAFLARKE